MGHFVYNIWFLEGSRPYWKGVNFCKGGEAAASKMFDDLVREKSLDYRPRLWVDCLDLPPGLLAGNFDAFDAAAFDEDELEALRDRLDDKDAPMAQVAEDEPRLDDLEPSPEDITRAAAELGLAAPRATVGALTGQVSGDVVMTVATTAAAQERSQSADRRQPWRDPSRAPAQPQPVAPPPVLPPSSLVPEPVDTASSAARKKRPQDAAPRTPCKRARGDAGEDAIGWYMDQAGMSATTPTQSVLLMAPCPAVTGLEMLAQPATPGAGWEPFQALGFSFRGGGAR